MKFRDRVDVEKTDTVNGCKVQVTINVLSCINFCFVVLCQQFIFNCVVLSRVKNIRQLADFIKHHHDSIQMKGLCQAFDLFCTGYLIYNDNCFT